MNDPQIVSELQRVNDSKSVSPMRQHNLKYGGARVALQKTV